MARSDQDWNTSIEGTFLTNTENDCHGGCFTSAAASLPRDMTLRPPPTHWVPSEQTPTNAPSACFLLQGAEETQHEDLDVSDLVDELIKDAHTNNMKLSHQPCTAPTDQPSHHRHLHCNRPSARLPFLQVKAYLALSCHLAVHALKQPLQTAWMQTPACHSCSRRAWVAV